MASTLTTRLYWPGWAAATALTGIVAGFMLGHALILGRFVDWLLTAGTPAQGLEYAAFRATAGLVRLLRLRAAQLETAAGTAPARSGRPHLLTGRRQPAA